MPLDSPITRPAAAEALDLSTCAREPIHTPGSIQPYGMLLVLDGDGCVQQAAIAPQCGLKVGELLGQPAASILEALPPLSSEIGPEPVFLGAAKVAGALYNVVAHNSSGLTIAELEIATEDEPGSFEELYPTVRSFLGSMGQAGDVLALGALAAREVRRLTGFDRTMIYRFDENWHGTVIAEDGNGQLPSYLDLRFPASDIPAQARELYRRNKLRLIADADYAPVPLEPPLDPASGSPVDLSHAMLRSVSPVHLEYMRNMETWASMSISLIVDGKLWGLISCHNRTPRRVPYHVRTACEFLGEILSLQIGAREHAAEAQSRVERRKVHTRLLARVAGEPDFARALADNGEELLGLTGAGGAAILFEGRCIRIGEAPEEQDVRALAEWLESQSDGGDLFDTDRLSALKPDFETVVETASGVMAVSISQVQAAYILWFRPEVIQTVRWGGDPRKPAETNTNERISPRRSFEAWRETVRHRSLPWTALDREMALELRTSVIDIVLRKAEEMAALNDQLVRTNKELEAFSYSISHDLRAPFRHIVGYSELLLESAAGRLDQRDKRYVATIADSAKAAGQLVDSLLNFSQLGRASLGHGNVDMNLLVADARARLDLEIGDRTIEWHVAKLPEVHGDLAMLQQVVHNLLSNAVKFTRDREVAVISIEHDRVDGEDVFAVRDNGCGFEMAYVGKLFGVFQRLHHSDDFDGTGIGLANVRRVIERHGGRTWAEGKLGEGAAFFFSLPIKGEK